MEEIVRAFNYVIEKGWVSVDVRMVIRHYLSRHINTGVLLGNIRVVRSPDRGGIS